MTIQIMKLGDVCHTFTGGTPSRTKPEYFGGGIPWVKITDLLQGVVTATGESVSSAGISNSSAKLLPVGTVLISIFATIGRTAVLGIEAATNQAIAGVVPHDTAQLDPQYLRYYLDSQHGYLNREARGVAQPNINQGILKNLDIPIPSLPEQRRIVDLLSRAEGIVRLRREAEKKAAALIPALFNDMFGDPVTNPKGWPVETLGRHVTIPSAVRTPDLVADADMPCMGADSIESMSGKLISMPTVRDVLPKSGKYSFDAGDVLYSKIRPYLAKATLAQCKGYCSADMYPLRCNPTLRSTYLLTMLLGRAFTDYATSESVRASMPKLNRESLFKYQFPLPPMELQSVFAVNADSVLSIQSQQSTATAKAQATFDALLADAFKAT